MISVCGLFGMVRATGADPVRSSEMLLHLGVLAEERGLDAAGLAFGLPGAGCPVPADPARRRDVRCGRWRIVKQPGPFRALWRLDLFSDLDAASVVLGHTRWATQGPVGRLVNTSPLVVGRIVGTHNGDIDVPTLRRFHRGRTVGDTDTAVLLAALAAAGDDPDGLAQILDAAVLGRAALAWSPVTGPRTLWLARAGLSPLAVARDDEGSLYWASNPDWLRRAARQVDIRLSRPPMMLATGMLLNIVCVDGRPGLGGSWTFKPSVRPGDVRSEGAVWRGFTAADRSRDRSSVRHRIRPVAATSCRTGAATTARPVR